MLKKWHYLRHLEINKQFIAVNILTISLKGDFNFNCVTEISYMKKWTDLLSILLDIIYVLPVIEAVLFVLGDLDTQFTVPIWEQAELFFSTSFIVI